jgi:hypothetical protein
MSCKLWQAILRRFIHEILCWELSFLLLLLDYLFCLSVRHDSKEYTSTGRGPAERERFTCGIAGGFVSKHMGRRILFAWLQKIPPFFSDGNGGMCMALFYF